MKTTRRDFVMGMGVAAAAMGLNSSVALAQTADGALIYEGRAQGLRGHIGVHVTLDEEGIQKIDVVENTETPVRLANACIAKMVPAMVEAQSTNVDGVTGATFSTMALRNAVIAALEAAGVADAYDVAAPELDVPAAQDCECDILVVGAGLSGCQAAVAASYEEYGVTRNDLKVVLIEKQGLVGGSSMLAGGAFRALQPLHDGSNLDLMFEDTYPTCFNEGYPLDKEMAYNVLEISRVNAFQNLQLGHGFLTNTVPMQGFKDPSEYTSLKGKFMVKRPYPLKFGEGVWSFAGYKNIEFMDVRLAEAGVEIRLDTRAVELAVEDGAVAGVKVQGPAGEYVIRAKKVILATGGFAQNAEYVERYAPSYVNAVKYCNAGCTGDAIAMVEPLGGYVDGFDDCSGPLGTNNVWGGFNDLGYEFDDKVNFPIGFGCVIVNAEGKRFIKDSLNMAYNEGPTPKAVALQPEGMAWSIFDSANEASVAAVENSCMTGCFFKADSIEELAEQIGVDPAALAQTVSAYNELAASGADDEEFGVANADMVPVTEAPFFAVTTRGTVCICQEGIRTGAHCEVVNAEGDVVPNLYCVGEAGYYAYVLNNLGICLATGRLAAEDAKANIA